MTKWLSLKNIMIVITLAILAIVFNIVKPKAELKLKKIVATEVLKFEDIKDFNLNNLQIGLLPPHVEFSGVDLLLKKYPELKKIHADYEIMYVNTIYYVSNSISQNQLLAKRKIYA